MATARSALPWLAALVCAGVASGALSLAVPPANAQTIDVGRARDFVVGTPPGARVDRVDGARSASTRTPLPVGGLRTAWRASAGSPVEGGPLVDAQGRVYVVNVRGDVVAFGADGTEAWHLATSALQPGPAALLSDDTVVFTDGTGDALAVRGGALRWRARFGRAEPSVSSPLPLDDGGVIVATGHDLALLDAEGHTRARAVLAEGIAAPLLAAPGRVLAVTASGAVWGWTPGASDAVRLASFGVPVDGGVVLADDHTLLAVTGGQSTLGAVDLGRAAPGNEVAAAPGGLWLGAPTLRRRGRGHGDEITLALLGPLAEFAVTVDRAGRELRRTVMTSRVPLARGDGGAPSALGLLASSAGTALLVDDTGTLAFAALDGALGVTSVASASRAPDAAGDGGASAGGDADAGEDAFGAVETLSNACPSSLGLGLGMNLGPGALGGASGGANGLSGLGALGGPTSPVVGLAPLAPHAFVALCRSGAVVAVTGTGR